MQNETNKSSSLPAFADLMVDCSLTVRLHCTINSTGVKEGFYGISPNERTLPFSNSNSILQLLLLLDDLAEEGEDEEREDGAPDEGVEDHERPPENTLRGGAESVGNGVAGLSEEAALEEQEEDKVDDAERDICEEEGFHCGAFRC